MLTDPTGGIGWAYGETLSSTAMTTIATNQPKAADFSGGGSYTPGAVVNVEGSGFGTVKVATKLYVTVGGQLVNAVGADIDDTNNQTIRIADGMVREFVTPGAQRDHDMADTLAVAGSWIHLIRPATGAFAIVIRRSGFVGGAIVTLPSATFSTATLHFKGGVWRLLAHSDATPGADA